MYGESPPISCYTLLLNFSGSRSIALLYRKLFKGLYRYFLNTSISGERGTHDGHSCIKILVWKGIRHEAAHTILLHLIRAPNKQNHTFAPILGGIVTGRIWTEVCGSLSCFRSRSGR